MAIVINSYEQKNAGSEQRVDFVANLGIYSNTGDINTTGILVDPASMSMSGFTRLVVNQENGYQIEVLYSASGPAVTYPTPVRLRVLQATGGGGGNTGNTSGGTPSGTNSSVSAGTPTGTVAAPVFAGNAMGNHTHTFGGSPMANHTHGQIQQQELKVPVANQTTILIQSPNIQGVYATAGGVTGNLTHVPGLAYLASGTYFYDYATNTFSFFAADAITEVLITYLGINLSASAGTPAGSISNDSAGTPTGTNSAPAFAGDALAGHSHVFAGDALATHNHTYVGGGSFTEVVNGTDLSVDLGAVQITAYGV